MSDEKDNDNILKLAAQAKPGQVDWKAFDEASRNIAEIDRRTYLAYIKAGFNPAQALHLVVATITARTKSL